MRYLNIYGDDDFAVTKFDAQFNVQDVVNEMNNRGIEDMELLSNDGSIIYVDINEFKTIKEAVEWCEIIYVAMTL